MSTGILTWQNENGRTSYPLTKSDSVVNNFIVDANFVQFDNFVPILSNVIVSDTDMQITVEFDLITATVTYTKTSYNSGARLVTFYDNANNYNKRFLGRITIGDGAMTLWNNYTSQQLDFNVPFIASTVRSIPSTDAIYSIGGRFGDIVFSHDSTDDAIFYDSNATNWICFNAVQNSRFPVTTPPPVLKLLNLVAPVDNNVFIGYNDIIQVNSTTSGTLKISLVTSDFLPSSITSTLSK